MPSTYSLTKLSNAALLCIGATLLQGCSEKIDARQTQTVQGLIYKLNASDPFTGSLTNFQPNDLGVPVHGTCNVGIKNGVLDGTAVCSLESGVKFLEINYVGGRQNGVMTQWNTSGKLILKTDFKDGMKDGVEEKFNPENGKMVGSTHWTANQKNGEEKIWDASGENILTQLVWKIGGGKTGYVKSGEFEYNYKDGNADGSQKKYTWVGDYAKITEARIRAQQAGADYFIPLVTKNAADYTFSEEIYVNGEQKQSEAKPIVQAQAVENQSQQCLDLKINAFRKENGEDAPIIDDVIQEWKASCKK